MGAAEGEKKKSRKEQEEEETTEKRKATREWHDSKTGRGQEIGDSRVMIECTSHTFNFGGGLHTKQPLLPAGPAKKRAPEHVCSARY